MGAIAARLGVDDRAMHAIVRQVTDAPASRSTVRSLKADFVRLESGAASAFERYALLTAAIVQLSSAPVALGSGVRRVMADRLRRLAECPEHAPPSPVDVDSAAFVALAKIVTSRRFPAGQFDWEPSGIPRSVLLRIPARRLPALVGFIAFRMGGFGPIMFSHLSQARAQKSLDEREAKRSYFRMAKTLEVQPEMRGFAAWSWFRAPATHAVSPHLAWLSTVFLENGGFVSDCGPDDPSHGALYRSATRRRLYERGEYVPAKGLVLWPRRAMLRWADRHPEFDD